MQYLADQLGIDGLWPANARFANHWVREPLYRQDSGQRMRQLLLELEAAQSRRPFREITIEAPHLDHIMPQDWSDAAKRHWPDPSYDESMAMDDIVRARNTAVDSIGNLALLEPQLNAKLRNAGFEERRAIYGQSRYLATRALAEHDHWNEQSIRARAAAWLPLANQLWPGPEAALDFSA